MGTSKYLNPYSSHRTPLNINISIHDKRYKKLSTSNRRKCKTVLHRRFNSTQDGFSSLFFSGKYSSRWLSFSKLSINGASKVSFLKPHRRFKRPFLKNLRIKGGGLSKTKSILKPSKRGNLSIKVQKGLQTKYFDSFRFFLKKKLKSRFKFYKGRFKSNRKMAKLPYSRSFRKL